MIIVEELLAIIKELLPMLHKDEVEKILARIEKAREADDAKYKEILDKLKDIAGADSLPALNALFAELHGRM